MITSASTASTASYPDEMMMMAAATQRHQQQQQHSNQEGQASMSPYGSGAIDLSWQSSSPNSGNHHYYAPSQQTSNNGHPAMFSPSISNSGSGNNCYQTARPYSVGYSQSSDIENSQPMAMQPPLSVYYPHDYGLKQNSVYSIMDANNMTFVTPYNNTNVRSNENMLFAPNSGNDSMGAIKTEDIGLKNPSPCCYGQQNGVAPSPSLSPSSSSTSTSSSPVHPAYHESTSNHDSYIPQQRQNSQQTPQSVHSPALNLLSHNHQPLF
jgi:hypothetical protein